MKRPDLVRHGLTVTNAPPSLHLLLDHETMDVADEDIPKWLEEHNRLQAQVDREYAEAWARGEEIIEVRMD